MPGIRVGIGHDTHRLEDGGPLRIGGIEIPHSKQLVGHSDADVLLHAVTDAVLGAAGLGDAGMGDIGEMFPDTAPENRGRDSAEMLTLAYKQVRQAGFRVGNLDCILFAQAPKFSPYKQALRQRLADLLELPIDRIGVKAKTGEGLGMIGEQQAISAECVVLLEQTS